MKKLTISALDSLFSYLNKPDSVFWMRDKSYKKQIYVSPSFESIWGMSTTTLYNATDSKLLLSTLIEEDGKDKWIALDKQKRSIARQEIINSDSQSATDLLIRIKDAGGIERYLLDSHYCLIDDTNNHLGFSGIVQTLTKEEWYARYYMEKSNTPGQLESLKKHIFDVLYQEAGITAQTNLLQPQQHQDEIPHYVVPLDGKNIHFTKRESECIYHLKQGKTAKQTADILCRSYRTVEFHLANACEKANCRSKLELLSLMQNAKR